MNSRKSAPILANRARLHHCPPAIPWQWPDAGASYAVECRYAPVVQARTSTMLRALLIGAWVPALGLS
jgi:hypothetical protein